MKQLFLFILFIPLLNFAQDEEERVTQIKSWYKDVESRLANCLKIPLTMYYDEDYVTGGSTEIEGYYDTITKEIIKIVEHTYYDWAEDQTSFYFHEGELFFIFSKGNNPGEMYTAKDLGVSEEELWEMGGEAKSLNYYEERYYYNDQACFKHLAKRKEIDVEESSDLKEVHNEKQNIDVKETLSLQSHGYKIYREYMKQLKPSSKK